MRLEKATAVLNLARILAGSADGLTIDEIAKTFAVGRRTAERMRDAVEAVFGPLEWIEDERKRRFRIAARGLGNFAVAPTSDELLELENAARALEKRHDLQRASILRSLAAKIQASLREADRRRLGTDVEALVRAETFARQVGPRPFVAPELFAKVRQSLLMQKIVSFDYVIEQKKKQERVVIPYGVIFASRYYLVGCVVGKKKPVLFRLDRVQNFVLMERAGVPPADFDIEEYANRSFSVFQEQPEQITLIFDPSAAQDARSYFFHPSQTFTDRPDGSLLVTFRAGGFFQLAHHLMTWGDSVIVIEPQNLADLLRAEIKKVYEHHVIKSH